MTKSQMWASRQTSRSSFNPKCESRT